MKTLKLLVLILIASFLQFASFAQYQQPGDFGFHRVNGNSFVFRTSYPGAGSGNPNRVIEIDSAIFADNEKVQVYDAYSQNGSISGKVQEWLFIPSGRIDGQMSYYVINRWYGTYLQASAINGQVKAKVFNGQLNQKWFIDNGIFGSERYLRSASSGLYLTFPGSANGSPLTMQGFNFSISQRIFVVEFLGGSPLWAYNWNYSQPTLIRLADNNSLVLGDAGMSSSSVQNQVVVLQNRVPGANYQVWEPYTESFPGFLSQAPGEDGIRFFKRYTGYTIAPWNNNGAQGFGITTRLYEPDPGTYQRWYTVPSRVDGQYILVHAQSGLTIQPQYNGVGALLVFVPISSASSQRWIFTGI